jgi:Kef-type K+ transport system membrane component KefB
MKCFKKISLGFWFFVFTFLLVGPTIAFATTENDLSSIPTTGLVFLWLAIILIGAKIGGAIEKLGQSAVLGELLYGIILGNLALIGFSWFEPIRHNEIIRFLADLGIVILLFQIGLESNISEMKKLGTRAFVIAVVGVVATFILGTYIAGPLLLPGLPASFYMFLGATLTATSVSISARVFKDLGKINTKEAQLVLGAAVIDDVLGLIVLAVATAMITAGAIAPTTVGLIIIKAVSFLIGAIVLGQIIAPYLGKMFAKIHTGIGMKFTLAISFGLILAYLAEQIGLAPIIGAFAAGLILDPVHFHYFKDHKIVRDIKNNLEKFDTESKEHLLNVISPYANRHIDDLIEPLAHFLVPIFFVMTGFAVNLANLLNLQTIILALGLTLIAIVGKLLAGFAAGKNNKLVVGVGMIPRGEVELIFAVTGKNLGIFNDQVFSAIVLMVILTAILVPPVLSFLLKTPTKTN